MTRIRHVVPVALVGQVATKRENAVQILLIQHSGLSILAILFIIKILNTGEEKHSYQPEVTKW
jgi:hypothetical protein